MLVKTADVFGWLGLPRPVVEAGQLRAMKLSHENQSKKGRNCSGGAFGGAFFGIGTTLGMLPLMTTGGMDGKFAAVANSSAANAAAEKSARLMSLTVTS
jgi:hypothetical protein